MESLYLSSVLHAGALPITSPVCPELLREGPWCLSRFNIRRRIGEGFCSKVYACQDRASGISVALKLYSAAAATDYEQLREMIDNEIAVHSSLCHPHILRFYGAFREDDYLALVLQLAPQGDLLGVMGRIPRDEHTVSRLIAAPLLSALAYLHGRGLVHRDIKPENVFVDDSDVFLGDFGFARSQRRGTLRSAVGTVHFMAPEILRNTLEGGRWGDYVPRDERVPYGPEVDVWSLGVVLYELLTRRLPFTGDSQQSVCDAVLAGPPPPPQDPLISLPRLPVAHAHDRPCAARHKPRAAYAPLHPRPHQPRVALPADGCCRLLGLLGLLVDAARPHCCHVPHCFPCSRLAPRPPRSRGALQVDPARGRRRRRAPGPSRPRQPSPATEQPLQGLPGSRRPAAPGGLLCRGELPRRRCSRHAVGARCLEPGGWVATAATPAHVDVLGKGAARGDAGLRAGIAARPARAREHLGGEPARLQAGLPGAHSRSGQGLTADEPLRVLGAHVQEAAVAGEPDDDDDPHGPRTGRGLRGDGGCGGA